MELEFIDISDRREHQSTERTNRQAAGRRAQPPRREPARREPPRRRQGGTDQYRRRMRQSGIPEGQERRRPVSCEEQERRQQRREQLRQRQARERYRQRQLQRRRRKILLMKAAVFGCLVLLATLLAVMLPQILSTPKEKKALPDTVRQEETEVLSRETVSGPGPGILEDFLTVNEYSRPGEALETVNNIFVHYTANPGTSAAQNRSYFENLGITGETSASAHFVIGYEGEIIQCIPLDEIAYAVQKRNYDSISIECCYLDSSGKFTDATYDSLVELSAWLLQKYGLSPSDMRRHYDEGGKKCPLYFVEHEDAWRQFIGDVERYMINREEA